MSKTSVWVVTALAAVLGAACAKADSASTAKIKELEGRISKLEDGQKKFSEIDGFVRPIMAQQKAQQAQKDAQEPDPDARFAVNISGDHYDGPEGAPVTIVEAFDFA